MLGNTRRLIRDLSNDLADARSQCWNALTEMNRLLAENNELREEVEALEAVCMQQERELLEMSTRGLPG